MRSVNKILQDIKDLSDYHMPQGDCDRIESFCNEITKYIDSLERQNAQMDYELEKLKDKSKDKKEQVKRNFPPEIGQIMKNQIVIMGMLQDMQEELEEIPNITETYKILRENKE